MKPWHIKASYKIYDFEGKLVTTGIWEYWWASPKIRRRSWKRHGLSRTDWITEDSTVYRKESGEPLHYFERILEDVILYPGPDYEMIAAGKIKLGLKVAGKGATSLTCLTAIRQQEVGGKSQVPPQAAPNYYCFDPGTMALMTTYSGFALNQYSQFVKMQDHYIARRISVQVGQQASAEISIDSIDGIDPTDPAFIRAIDAVPIAGSAHYTSDSPPPSRVSGGKLLREVQVQIIGGAVPHMHGDVLLSAEVGTDGKVRRADVLTAPSKVVAQEVVDAVEQWVYEPFTINDKPIEMAIPIRMKL